MKDSKNMAFDKLLDYWSGYIVLAIDSGNFRNVISLMLQDTIKNSDGRGANDTLKNKG